MNNEVETENEVIEKAKEVEALGFKTYPAGATHLKYAREYRGCKGKKEKGGRGNIYERN